MLIGIVTKNGILIVEFANQRRRAGLAIKEAVIDAAARRFRPIIMTSLATILGAMPIAFAIGAFRQKPRPDGYSHYRRTIARTYLHPLRNPCPLYIHYQQENYPMKRPLPMKHFQTNYCVRHIYPV